MKIKKLEGIVLSALVMGLVALVPVLLYMTPLSYLYCCWRQESWFKATDEADLERRLMAFYSKRRIDPGESSWGRDHVLTDGQRMVCYTIFGKEPLDVVLNRDGTVDTIYTSYE